MSNDIEIRQYHDNFSDSTEIAIVRDGTVLSRDKLRDRAMRDGREAQGAEYRAALERMRLSIIYP